MATCADRRVRPVANWTGRPTPRRSARPRASRGSPERSERQRRRVSAGDWSVAQNTCQHARGGGGGDRRADRLITWDVDGDGLGDFATEDEAEAYMLKIYLQDPDPDATGPDYDAIEVAFQNCYRCDGPDRASWVDPESESDDLLVRPRPGGFFGSIGAFFSSVFGGGNNNDNDDNDDNDNQDQGSRPPPATERPRPSFWDRLLGRAT